MNHTFSNCPLRNSSLLITHHKHQTIVTATDDILDLLGYLPSELIGRSVKDLELKLSANLSAIPECTIRNAEGRIVTFQVCIHQDPLGSTSCLDYWLLKQQLDTSPPTLIETSNNISMLRLSPYGTIEQVQLATNFNQSIQELVGKPIMAFVYGDDVQPLCANLSKICSLNKNEQVTNPMFVRWSKLPCLLSSSIKDQEESLNYDLMSFSLVPITSPYKTIKPVCIVRPLQIILETEACEELVVLQLPLFGQLLDYCKSLMEQVEDSVQQTKNYVQEFCDYIIYSIIQSISTFLYHFTTSNKLVEHQTQVTDIVPIQQSLKDQYPFVWNLVKSNYIMQCSLSILDHFLIDQKSNNPT